MFHQDKKKIQRYQINIKLNKVGGKSSSEDPNGETINIFKYVANVSQTNGQLAAEAQAIITDLDSFKSTTEEGKLVSAVATKNYINGECGGLNTKLDDLNTKLEVVKTHVGTKNLRYSDNNSGFYMIVAGTTDQVTSSYNDGAK